MNQTNHDFKGKFKQSIEQSMISYQVIDRFEEYFLNVRKKMHEENAR